MNSRLYKISWPEEYSSVWLCKENLERIMFNEDHIGGVAGPLVNVEELVLEEHIHDADDQFAVDRPGVIKNLAKRILMRLVECDHQIIKEVENFWLDEFSDILYMMFPDSKHNLQDLVNELHLLKVNGVTLKLNTNGIDLDEDATYIIEP